MPLGSLIPPPKRQRVAITNKAPYLVTKMRPPRETRGGLSADRNSITKRYSALKGGVHIPV